MDRSEPSLVPEWLKTAGSLNGGGSTSHSDNQTASKLVRNKSFVNTNGHDFGRTFSSDRTTSSYFRRSSSSNGSGHLRPHSSFSRSQHDRDRDWEKDTYDSRDKDKSFLGDRRHRDFSDMLGNTLFSKFERDGLRRSQSMVSGKRGDTWHKKVVTDLSSAGGDNTDGLLGRGSPIGMVNKTTFERDFPSLGAEERAVTPEIGRVPSPGLSSAIQSLPMGTAIINGDKWTSALAEVPVIVGSSGTVMSSVQQTTPSTSTSVGLGTTTSLNMAEAVAQGPSRTQTTPQLSVGTQRLEELAIKQSRQLIPVTPSMPKTLVLTSSDKQKNKTGHQQSPTSSSLAVNHSPRGGPVKGDVSFSKAPNVGKLHVLKPAREKNGTTPVVKDNSSPTNGSKPVSSAPAAAPVSGSTTTRGPLNNSVPDRKPALTVLEKRPTSQAQSRNDFFNSVRKKSVANSSSVAESPVANSSTVADSSMANSSSSDKVAEMKVVCAPDTPLADDASLGVSLSGIHLSEAGGDLTCSGGAENHVSNGKKHPISDAIFSEEEEAAFLRSLGWEENAADEGGLTEEEINAFLRDVNKYINSKPSLKIFQGIEPKFLLPFNSHISGISSGLSSSDTKMES